MQTVQAEVIFNGSVDQLVTTIRGLLQETGSDEAWTRFFIRPPRKPSDPFDLTDPGLRHMMIIDTSCPPEEWAEILARPGPNDTTIIRVWAHEHSWPDQRPEWEWLTQNLEREGWIEPQPSQSDTVIEEQIRQLQESGVIRDAWHKEAIYLYRDGVSYRAIGEKINKATNTVQKYIGEVYKAAPNFIKLRQPRKR